MTLKSPGFKLPEWREKDLAALHRLRARAEQMAAGAGQSSWVFKDRRARFLAMDGGGRGEEIVSLLEHPSDVRALCSLWASEPEFFKKIPPNELLLKSLFLPSPVLGKLALQSLVSVYFTYFDQVGTPSVRRDLEILLKNELARLENSPKRPSGLFPFFQHRELLFCAEGPANVVQAAQDLGVSLGETYARFGLSSYGEGRFKNLCGLHYYLETLKKIPLGEKHPVIKELLHPSVYKTPLPGGALTLGHAAVKILIDRGGEDCPSDAWRNAIVTIAGDPRLPPNSPAHMHWWTHLGDERTHKVRGWLSRIDLVMFLRIIEEYAVSAGNGPMLRMFPARKAFLEGLWRQGLVKKSRLFVSKRADAYLRKNYAEEDLPQYARLNDANRSVIYMQIGDHHITEGSHSYKFWVFPTLPPNSRILDLLESDFNYQELSSDIEEAAHPSDRYRIKSFTHSGSANFSWQVQIIRHFRTIGINLDLEPLFSPEDYAQFQSIRRGLLL